MDKSMKALIASLVVFLFLSTAVASYLVILCRDEAIKSTQKEYESRIVYDNRGPILKDLERKALGNDDHRRTD